MGASVGDSIMAPTGVVRTVCGDRGELHIRRYLVKEFGQHGRVTDVAPGNLDGPDLQRLFIDADVDLAPQTAFRATMLAGMPRAFGGLTPRHWRDGPTSPRPP